MSETGATRENGANMNDQPVALVTGGASGMGLAIVRRMANDGYLTVMADRDEAAANREAAAMVAEGLPVLPRIVDLTDEAATRAMAQRIVAEHGPIAALVNNAGIFDERAFDTITSADFRRAYEINLIAITTLTQEVTRTMKAGGRIVNIASRAYLGARNHPHYVASKAALVGYTRASAMELASRQILVNAIAPGLIDTPILRALTPERLAQQLALQPTGKAGSPDDVARAVAFLASSQTDFITGQVLFVDGGKSLGGSGA